jgi:predicted CopG family antitoxin
VELSAEKGQESITDFVREDTEMKEYNKEVLSTSADSTVPSTPGTGTPYRK